MRAERRRQGLGLLFGDRIVHVIRRRIGFLLQNGKIALQFVAEDVQQRGSRSGSAGEREKQGEQKATHELTG